MENQKKTIFLIEDDPDLSNLVAYNLKKAGYEVITALSGLETLWELARKTRPDCVLLDLMMPTPDGFEICDYLKSSEDFKDIPIIIISAKSSAEDMEQALELGADVYLPKPFPMDSLLSLVKKYSNPRGEIRFAGN